jgi:hypothetical protein
LAHSSGTEALVAPSSATVVNVAQRRNAYDQIIKWIQQGANNN